MLRGFDPPPPFHNLVTEKHNLFPLPLNVVFYRMELSPDEVFNQQQVLADLGRSNAHAKQVQSSSRRDGTTTKIQPPPRPPQVQSASLKE